jgi:hypothetical protein
MDKHSFVDSAPAYYALALAVALLNANPRRGDAFTLEQLENYGGSDLNPILVKAGMRLLQEVGVAETIKEAFGPPLYGRTDALTQDWLYTNASFHFPIFLRYSEIRNADWLKAAIADVNDKYFQLSLTEADFEEAPPSVWEPLQLDRGDEQLVEVTAKVDEAIASIEADNGYAANVPGERDYVVSSLKAFSKTLKENAQITVMQIKTFALEPLGLVLNRFAGSALALVAAAAKDSLLTFLKSKFGALLAGLFS